MFYKASFRNFGDIFYPRLQPSYSQFLSPTLQHFPLTVDWQSTDRSWRCNRRGLVVSCDTGKQSTVGGTVDWSWINITDDKLDGLARLHFVLCMSAQQAEWQGTGALARVAEKRDACLVVEEKPEGKETPERPSCTSRDNIKMDLKKIGREIQWRDMWKAVENTVINFWIL